MTLKAILIACVCATGASAGEPGPARPLRDLGGGTYRAEVDGFKVTLTFDTDDVKVYLTTPGIIAFAMHVCTVGVEGAAPTELVCEHGRKVSLVPTTQGYQVTLGGTLAAEARAWLGERQYGPQGPVAYDARPKNPVELAFLEVEFRPPAGTGNTSAETEVLRGLVPARRPPPLTRSHDGPLRRGSQPAERCRRGQEHARPAAHSR